MSTAAERPPRISSCPQCGQSTRLDEANRWRPFCSERCKLVELGAWFGEHYRIPGDAPPDTREDSLR